MKKVRILDVPPGSFPLDVRVQFVGVSMPYDLSIQTSGNPESDTHIVRTNDVIAALREYRQNNAADFLCHAGVEEKYLQFPKGICELIED